MPCETILLNGHIQFHIRGHTEKACRLEHEECVYHPDTLENQQVFGDMNLEVGNLNTVGSTQSFFLRFANNRFELLTRQGILLAT